MNANVQMDTKPTATDLLANYHPGNSFFFASPHATLLAQGTLAVLPDPKGQMSLSPYQSVQRACCLSSSNQGKVSRC